MQKFQELLKPYKIMVRDCSNFDYLNERFVNCSEKSSVQMNFKRLLKTYMLIKIDF